MISNIFIENLLITTISTIFFSGLSYALIKNDSISSKVQNEKKNLWYNTMTSMIHSAIVSVFCVICFHVEPDLWLNMCSPTPSNVARLITNISIGYFVYDFFDTTKSLNLAIQWPVLAHHVIVVSEFMCIGWYLGFYNYLIVALTCEVNTVFLHLRQLFHLSKINQESFVYKLNKHTNFITYLVFRMVTLIWLIIGSLVLERDRFPSKPILLFGCFGMLAMFIINSILLWRLIRKDYLSLTKKLKST